MAKASRKRGARGSRQPRQQAPPPSASPNWPVLALAVIGLGLAGYLTGTAWMGEKGGLLRGRRRLRHRAQQPLVDAARPSDLALGFSRLRGARGRSLHQAPQQALEAAGRGIAVRRGLQRVPHGHLDIPAGGRLSVLPDVAGASRGHLRRHPFPDPAGQPAGCMAALDRLERAGGRSGGGGASPGLLCRRPRDCRGQGGPLDQRAGRPPAGDRRQDVRRVLVSRLREPEGAVRGVGAPHPVRRMLTGRPERPGRLQVPGRGRAFLSHLDHRGPASHRSIVPRFAGGPRRLRRRQGPGKARCS